MAEFEAEQGQSSVFGKELLVLKPNFPFEQNEGLRDEESAFAFSGVAKRFIHTLVVRRGFPCFSAVSLCELHVFAMEILRSLQENSFSLSLELLRLCAGGGGRSSFLLLPSSSALLLLRRRIFCVVPAYISHLSVLS